MSLDPKDLDVWKAVGKPPDVVWIVRGDNAAPQPDGRRDDERIDRVPGVHSITGQKPACDLCNCLRCWDDPDAPFEDPIHGRVLSSAAIDLDKNWGRNPHQCFQPASRGQNQMGPLGRSCAPGFEGDRAQSLRVQN